MDEVLLARLRLINDKVSTDLEEAPNIVNLETLGLAQVFYCKLEASLKRLSCDLVEYFRLASEPAADEISAITGQQLRAEEILAELKAKIDQITSVSKSIEKPQEVNSSCRLPKLQLPVYNGDVLGWCEFWDSFRSNIDSRNISDVDKLSYLKASVTGDAKKAIDGLSTTNANYGIAVSILKERFGKSSHLVDAHYATLYKVRSARSTAEDCRRTFNEIERNLKILESLGENINHNHLRFMLLEKFPSDLVYEIKLKVSNDSIQELRGQLDRIITAKEDADRISGRKRTHESEDSTVGTLHIHAKRAKGSYHPYPKKQEQQREFDKNRNQKRRFKGFNKSNRWNNQRKSLPSDKPREEMKQSPSGEKKDNMSCIFCKGAHYNDSGTKVSTLNERKRLLAGRCYICLRKDHYANKCTDDKKCFHCQSKSKHNRALCPSNFQKDMVKKRQP